MKSRYLILVGLLALAVLWSPAPLRADEAAQGQGVTLDVDVGFDGYAETGEWLPVFVTAANSGPDVSGEIVVEAAVLAGGTARYARPIDLPRGSRKLVTLYLPEIPSLTAEVEVRLERRGRTLAVQKAVVQPVRPTALLIGVWSDTPGALLSLRDVIPPGGEAFIARLDAAEIPDAAPGLRALDVLFVYDADTGPLSFEQRTALHDWVVGGGQLVLIGGATAARVLGGLADLSPLAARDAAPTSLEPLAAFVGQPFEQGVSVEALAAGGDLAPGAEVLIDGEDGPLAAVHTIGQGRVVFFAADPALEPLASWGELGALWQAILASAGARPGWSYGFGENSDAARQAVGQIPGVSLPSVLALCGFLALYIVVIGPVNYLVLHRLKRREWAWFTIPALVLIFAAAAYVSGFSLRGSRVIVHRLAVVQSWSGDDTARIDALVGLWSPRRSGYDVQLEPGYLARQVPRALGGGLAAVSDFNVEQGGAVTLRDLRVDVGSIQPFIVEGYTRSAPRIEGDLRLNLSGSGVQVTGDIINYSDVPLTDATLLVAGSAISVGSLPANEVITVDSLVAGGSAVPLGGGGLVPYPPGASAYWGGQLAIDLTGSTECYYSFDTNQDRRRCNLANSILISEGRGSGAYLAGWAERVPLDTEVLNAVSEQIDLALYIVELRVDLEGSLEAMNQIPPGLTTWQVLDVSSGVYQPTPYGLYMDAGQSVVFRFEPLLPVEGPFEGFVLHLDMYGYDQSLLDSISVRNVITGDWELLTPQIGDTLVTGSRFVDARGGVELRIESSAQGYGVSIPRLDISLVAAAPSQG
ncbi:MAG: hypothetical protein Kow00124_25190 [Anaerolineae bacterium]